MDSIKFTIGGQIGASYRGALSGSIKEAEIANLRLQRTLVAQMKAAQAELSGGTNMTRASQLDDQITRQQRLQTTLMARHAEVSYKAELAEKMAADESKVASNEAAMARIINEEREAGIAISAEQDAEVLKAAEVAAEKLKIHKAELAEKMALDRAAWLAGQAEWNKIQAAQTTAMFDKFKADAEAAVDAKAKEMAEIAMVARRGGVGSASGGGHAYHGQGGIISEVAVIGHEMLQGRGMGRILGSISILAGRLGWLGKLVKSTAAAEISAAIAENTLAGSMARTAVAAEAKAAASLEATAAVGADTVATTALAAADEASAVAARAAATAQIAKATAATEAAEMAAASATVSLGPIGWAVITGIALTAVLVGIAFHLRTLAKEAKNLADMMDLTKRKFTEQAESIREDAAEHEKFLDWLKRVGEETDSLPEKIEKVIKAMREQSQAQQELARQRGASKMAIEQMEEAQLKAELMVATRGKLQAAREAEQAKDAALAANRNFTENPSENGVDLHSASRVAKNAGEIVDALEEKANSIKGDSASGIPALMDAIKSGKGGQTMEQAGFSEMMQTFLRSRGATGDMPLSQVAATVNKQIDDSPLKTTVDGKDVVTSLSAAKAAYAKSADLENRLSKVKQQLADTLADTKSTYEDKNKAVKKLTEEAADLQSQLGIKQTYGRQIAAGSTTQIAASEWERAGGSIGGISLLDVNKMQLTELRGIHAAMKSGSGDGLARIFGK